MIKPASLFLLFSLVALGTFNAVDATAQSRKPKISVPPKPIVPGLGGKRRGLAELPSLDNEMAEPALTRGATRCCMTFENKTGLFIDVWFDGIYQGRLSPWQQEVNLCLGDGGYKTFVAQSVGQTLEWEGNYDCGGTVSLSPR